MSRRYVLFAALASATITLGAFTMVGAQEAARVVPPEGDAAKYWPRWRGPGGQGVVADAGYPDQWSETQNILWKVPVSGAGNSSPIIWQDRIFLTTAYDKGKRRSILCF